MKCIFQFVIIRFSCTFSFPTFNVKTNRIVCWPFGVPLTHFIHFKSSYYIRLDFLGALIKWFRAKKEKLSFPRPGSSDNIHFRKFLFSCMHTIRFQINTYSWRSYLPFFCKAVVYKNKLGHIRSLRFSIHVRSNWVGLESSWYINKNDNRS